MSSVSKWILFISSTSSSPSASASLMAWSPSRVSIKLRAFSSAALISVVAFARSSSDSASTSLCSCHRNPAPEPTISVNVPNVPASTDCLIKFCKVVARTSCADMPRASAASLACSTLGSSLKVAKASSAFSVTGASGASGGTGPWSPSSRMSAMSLWTPAPMPMNSPAAAVRAMTLALSAMIFCAASPVPYFPAKKASCTAS
mmetsp:Transcript_32139/g.69464  ORF Transcript_32139/g.69464 Transcript_32139/m.69464 type:complete len:203 (-) Transcript_32139:542-1150(-)